MNTEATGNGAAYAALALVVFVAALFAVGWVWSGISVPRGADLRPAGIASDKPVVSDAPRSERPTVDTPESPAAEPTGELTVSIWPVPVMPSLDPPELDQLRLLLLPADRALSGRYYVAVRGRDHFRLDDDVLRVTTTLSHGKLPSQVLAGNENVTVEVLELGGSGLLHILEDVPLTSATHDASPGVWSLHWTQ